MNLLGIYPYQRSPQSEIACQIGDALSRFYTQGKCIEIEFKYAQLKNFFNNYLYNDLSRIKMEPNLANRVFSIAQFHALKQNQYHLETLRTLSRSSLVLLNNLNKKYEIKGDFHENTHKKFYKMREFLVKLCKQNQNSTIGNGLNFYVDLQKQIQLNKTLKLINFSEMRLDVNISNGEYAGRYSYEVGKGWTKTNKTNLLREQLDLMMNQRTFRLAVKEEKQVIVPLQTVQQALNQRVSFMRFKRSLKVQKGSRSVITLSQIFQPSDTRREELLEDLKFLLTMESFQLDQFVQERFQQFYMSDLHQNQLSDNRTSKFQIESEFTQNAVLEMLHLYKKYGPNKTQQLEKYLDSGLSDLYSLFFVDHNTKMRQTKVINEMKHSPLDFPDCRLENQYGSYMHDLVYNYMKN